MPVLVFTGFVITQLKTVQDRFTYLRQTFFLHGKEALPEHLPYSFLPPHQGQCQLFIKCRSSKLSYRKIVKHPWNIKHVATETQLQLSHAYLLYSAVQLILPKLRFCTCVLAYFSTYSKHKQMDKLQGWRPKRQISAFLIPLYLFIFLLLFERR